MSPSNVKGVALGVVVKGPFFDHGKKTIDDGSHEWIEEMVREGEAKVDAQLYRGHGVATGEYKASIHSAIKSSQHGQIDDSPNRQLSLRGAWLEGSPSRNVKHRFRGYGMWRKTNEHLQRIAKAVGDKVFDRAIGKIT